MGTQLDQNKQPDTPELAYKQAYELHYTEEKYLAAARSYLYVIERFGDTTEAGFAKTQLKNIRQKTSQPDLLVNEEHAAEDVLKSTKQKESIEKQKQDAIRELEQKKLTLKQAEKIETGNFSLRELLAQFCGCKIGINISDPSKFEPVNLVQVQADYIVVQTKDLIIHIPLSQIIRVMIANSGRVRSGLFSDTYDAIIIINHLIYKQGSVFLGLGMLGTFQIGESND